AAALGFDARLFLGLALGLRLAKLADRVLALGVDLLAFLDHAALDVGALLADLDVDGLGGRAALSRRHRDLADGTALERDLARRRRGLDRRLLLLAVGAAQEAEQLHLLGTADDLLGIGKLHAGFAKLGQQLVDRGAEDLGQLLDRDVRHRFGTPWSVLHVRLSPFRLPPRGATVVLRHPGRRACRRSARSLPCYAASAAARAAMINPAACCSSIPSMPSSMNSSVARSARFSRVAIPCEASSNARPSSMPSTASRSSAGWCSSMPSSTARASVSSASRARARSSSTMSSSKPSMPSSSAVGT